MIPQGLVLSERHFTPEKPFVLSRSAPPGLKSIGLPIAKRLSRRKKRSPRFETRALRFGILETLMPQLLARRDRALRWR